MTVMSVLDAAGRRRSPATLPGYHAGRPPRNKGMRYPADPPTVEEIVASCATRPRTVTAGRASGDRRLWRAGLRIQEALALAEHDLDPRRGSLLVRAGKGGRRREVGMDGWGWEQLRPWLELARSYRSGPLFWIIDGPTRGRPWSAAAVRSEFRRPPPTPASGAGSRRTSCAMRMRSSSPARACRSTSSSASSGTRTSAQPSIYLQGIDTEEIITAVHTRRAPMMSATAGLRL